MHLPANMRAIVVFTVAGHPYAIPTQRTREVVAWRPSRPLPGADSFIEGVINLRGQIIPVCDLAAALGVGHRGEPTLDTAIVIVESGSECVGLVVDAVRTVEETQSDELLDPGTAGHEAVVGIIRHGDELVVLLDPDAAIAGAQLHLGALVAAIDADAGAQPADATSMDAPLDGRTAA